MRLAFFLLTILCVSSISAQDIEVKKFEPLEKDQTATLNPRKDINGTVCGLVKVQLKEPGAEFDGNVMGEVQFTGSEYLVYLPNGTKRLGIKHPDYLPTTVVFADYGTKKIASSTTYELKVKTNKKQAKVDNSKKGIAVFNIKPSNAMLLIDGQIADGSGGAYTLSLPYGTHYYTVKLKDFTLNNQILIIDKAPKNIHVDLAVFLSQIFITSETKAQIYVNKEYKGMGEWKGLLPSGRHEISIQREGYYGQSRTIELFENDSINVYFPKMKITGGNIYVDYKPDGSDVYLDGQLIGQTPLDYKGVSKGLHRVVVRKENYVEIEQQVQIHEDQILNFSGKLELTNLGYLVEQSQDGDAKSQWLLGRCYMNNSGGTFTRNDKINGLRQVPLPKLERNIDKAIIWFKKAAEDKSHSDESSFAKDDLTKCFILKKDFNQSFYWAERCSDRLLKVLHYYYGLGTPPEKRKAARFLLESKYYIGRYNLDEAGLTACELGNGDNEVLKKSLETLAKNGCIEKEIYDIVNSIKR